MGWPLQSSRTTSRIVNFLMYSALLILTMTGEAQQLRRRSTATSPCPPTHLRFSARAADGSPIASLRREEIHVRLQEGPATVVSVESGFSGKSHAPDTDILFVAAPYAGLTESVISEIVSRMERMDDFHFNAAVLRPDGELSTFTSNLEQLRTTLLDAIAKRSHLAARAKWPLYEEKGFLALRALSGRHVIIILANPANPFRSFAKANFQNDRTLPFLASYDMAQIYQVLPEIPLSTTIPSGDAATLHEDIGGPDVHSFRQLEDLKQTSDEQAALWARQRSLGSVNGGRYGTRPEELIEDIAKDAPGAYDAVVQGQPGCRLGAFYSVEVTTTRPGTHLFAPRIIQMIPASDRPLPAAQP